MKGFFLAFFVLLLSGCSSINRMNSNLEESIQSVQQNTSTVQHSSEVISKNTQEVAHSTATMRNYFPVILVVIIAILIYPSFVLIKLQRKLLQDIRSLVEHLKK